MVGVVVVEGQEILLDVLPQDDQGVRWEVEGAHGHVLRVKETIAAHELAAVLAALTGRDAPAT